MNAPDAINALRIVLRLALQRSEKEPGCFSGTKVLCGRHNAFDLEPTAKELGALGKQAGLDPKPLRRLAVVSLDANEETTAIRAGLAWLDELELRLDEAELTPPTATPARQVETSPPTLRNLVDTFLCQAGEYFAWNHLTDLAAINAGENAKRRITDPADQSRISDAFGQRQTARRAMLDTGRQLAPRLEAAGENSTGLLAFLNAIDGGGGPPTAAPLWAPLKAALQRLADREALRLDAIPPGAQDWRDLAETCRELAGRLDANAGEPLDREPLEPLLAELVIHKRRLELDVLPMSWQRCRYADDGTLVDEGLEYRYPFGPTTITTLWVYDSRDCRATVAKWQGNTPPDSAEKLREFAIWLEASGEPPEIPTRRQYGNHEQTRREAAAALQTWIQHAKQKAAELTQAETSPPAANLGRERFNMASWPLYPFSERPQRLPTVKTPGLVLTGWQAAYANQMMPAPAPKPHIEGTATPGGTVRLERAGVAVELYFPTDADRATLASALPSCDLDNPPWHAVQAWIVSADLPADWAGLTAPAAVALLARTKPPLGATSTLRIKQNEGTGTGSQENKPPPAPAKATRAKPGKPPTPDDPLCERAQLVLQVLWQVGAVDSDSRMITAEIVKTGQGKDPVPYKPVVSDLRKRGYVDTLKGAGGGVWLTEKGKERAAKL
jgi:hypothetical protein